MIWTPDFSITDDTMIYGSIARGYKSGGFNVGSASNPTYDPEFVLSTEIGTKNFLFDRRLQFNAAIFRTDYENLGLGNLVDTSVINTNVPDSLIQGAEFELVVAPTEALRFEAIVGLLDSEIESNFLSSDPSRGSNFFELQGNELPNAPNRTIKLAMQYTAQLPGGWVAIPRIDYYWQDSFFAREFNTPADKVDSWEQLDLQINITNSESLWNVIAFVKNVLDDDSITHIETNSNLVGNFKNIFLLEPRTYALAVKYFFD